MSPENISLILLILLAALYLPVIANLLQKREGQENTTSLLVVYMMAALWLTALEGLRYGGRWVVDTQTAIDIQIYGALLLSVLMMLTVVIFVRRAIWTWLGVGVFWGLIVAAIAANVFRLGDIVLSNGTVLLTREMLAPAWSKLGWLVFTLGAFMTVRSAFIQSRQPLLRNRLNYWTPVFLLIAISDILLIVGRPIPGNPVRLLAASLGAFIIITHDQIGRASCRERVCQYV